MPILAAADVISPGGVGVLVFFSALAISGLRSAGMFEPRDESYLRRLFPAEPIGPLAINAGITMAVYFGVALAIGVVLHHQQPASASATQPTVITLTPAMTIIFSCLIPLVSLIWLLVGLQTVVPNGNAQLGVSRQPLLRAFGIAVGCLIASLPLLLLASNLSEALFRHLQWDHEKAHDLLLSMGEVDSLFEKILAIVAAVVLAPLSEELLFRGHIQTMIRRAIGRRWLRPAPVPLAVAGAASFDSAVTPAAVPGSIANPAQYLTPPPPPPMAPAAIEDSARTLWASVVAVLLTSLLFAAIHPWWSRGPIFVLALFLGFVYERRGNIWTNIFIHALFNGMSIALYLSTQHAAP